MIDAAAIESLVKSVVLELEDDILDLESAGLSRPNVTCLVVARRIAGEMAMKFCWHGSVDIAGFVAEPDRVAVLCHSMTTGRRITFYVSEKGIDAIQSTVSGTPVCSTPRIEAIPLLLGWIAQID